MYLDFPGSVFFHQTFLFKWNVNIFFTCYCRFSVSLMTLSSPFIMGVLFQTFSKHELLTSTPVLMGLSDRLAMHSLRTCFVCPRVPEHVYYLYCTTDSQSYCTVLHNAGIYLTQKCDNYACAHSFQQWCLVFYLLPYILWGKENGWNSVPHWAKW